MISSKEIYLTIKIRALLAVCIVIGLVLVHTISFAVSPSPVTISYSKSNSGTMLFSNNPERIHADELADYGGVGKGKIIYQERDVSGKIQTYYEHSNSTGSAMYFGVLLQNRGKSTVKITLYAFADHSGSGLSMYDRANIWLYFYSTYNVNGVRTITLEKGKSIWLPKQETMPVQPDLITEGVSEFYASAPITVNFIASKDNKNATGWETPLGYITRCTDLGNTKDEAKCYKGKTSTFPLITSNLSWKIDDKTTGSLPVTYPGAQGTDGWVTNFAKPSALISDILDITFTDYILGGSITFSTNNYKFAPNKLYNLGNWAVRYVDKFTVDNSSGTKKRDINYMVSGLTDWAEMVFYYYDSSGRKIINALTTKINSPSPSQRQAKAATFTIAARSKVTFEVQSVLCGNSTGNIKRSLVLAN